MEVQVIAFHIEVGSEWEARSDTLCTFNVYNVLTFKPANRWSQRAHRTPTHRRRATQVISFLNGERITNTVEGQSARMIHN